MVYYSIVIDTTARRHERLPCDIHFALVVPSPRYDPMGI
jgi:hypothetical protein